jgi:LPXTG-motif cell wall-anchored protein
MKRISKKLMSVLIVICVISGMLLIMPGLLNASPVFPSTNDINRTNSWAHVNEISKGVGEVTIQFVSTRNFWSCFEYRTDGDTSQVIGENGGKNYNTLVTDGLYPYDEEKNSSKILTIKANGYVEIRSAFGAESDERFDWTRFDVLPQPAIAPAGPAVYSITASTEGSGSITNPGVFNISAGASQVYTITPGDGASIVDVLVNGASVGPVSSYTFLNVNSSQTINAVFSSGGIEVAAITEEVSEEVTEETVPATIEVKGIATELPMTGQTILLGIFGLVLILAGTMLAVIYKKRRSEK